MDPLILTVPANSSGLLAIVTTAHLAFAALGNHRLHGSGFVSPLAIVSTMLAATPWLFPSLVGLAFGATVHAVWFAACGRLARPPKPAATSAPAAGAPRNKGFVEALVTAVVDQAPDIRTFRFARPDGFSFVAGQFLTVRVNVEGRDHARCYSLSSGPQTADHLEISVKRQGLVSSALHASLQPGSRLWVKAPAGAFVYPANENRPLLLIAGGIGITPLLSMLRHAVTADPVRRVTLLYSAQTASGLAFRDEIADIARANPQVRVVLAVTRGAAGVDIYPGRIDDALIHAMVADVAESIALLCGPQPMIDGLRGVLAACGVPASRMRSEVFEAAVAAGAGRNALADAHRASPGDPHHMRCARSDATVRVAPGQTLLEAAESQGVLIDSLCRVGVCGTCRTRVIDGDVRCESTMLDDSDRKSGYVLACVTHVHSDCTVEL
jgi:ferredoxin-NADP reductase